MRMHADLMCDENFGILNGICVPIVWSPTLAHYTILEL